MSWINKILPSISTSSIGGKNKSSVPEGIWKKCPRCDATLYRGDLERNAEVCPKCDHHLRISARRRIELFLDEGDILHEQYRDKPLKTYSVQSSGQYADIPMVVLVDANTASAAEIVAGALQAQGRAVLLGQTTYGKDSIQLAFDLSDGSSIHVTAAKWWLPGLEQDIGENGLVPDILVPLGETDLTLNAAIEYLSDQK